MHVPPVDIVLPYRDAEDTLPACLASIAAQTFRPWRLLAVDDGSRDGSTAVVRAFAAEQGPTVMLDSGGAGLVAALNLALAHADAPLIARMDADDTMHPERLARQVMHLEENPLCGVVGCQVVEDGLPGGLRRYVAWSNALLDHAAMFRARFIEAPLVHPTACFRRELVARHGGYRAGDFPEDYELWLRWMACGVRFAKVPAPLLAWRDRPERLTRTDPRYAVDRFFAVKAEALVRWLDAESPFGRTVWVWGAGYETRRRVRALVRAGVSIASFIDIDPRKIGTRNQDGPVVGPEALPGPEACLVLAAVGNLGARDLIAQELRCRGFIEGRTFLCIA